MALRLVLVCAAFGAIAAAAVSPANASTAVPGADGVYKLQLATGVNLTELAPLTTAAAQMNNQTPMLSGTLYAVNPGTVANLSGNVMAYISCDASDYPGNIDAQGVLQQALATDRSEATVSAAIFYSASSDYCNYSSPSAQDTRIFSMTDVQASTTMLDALRKMQHEQAMIGRFDGNSSGNTSAGDDGDQSPLGPSPSTAVAMIILYSITGIITALFLIIIVTGAIRAHRHPDRYGPRDALGRPRQSRARGLGRAILDTLPIVKFGEREAPKPLDVEMSPTAGQQAVDADAEASSARPAEGSTSVPPAAGEQPESSSAERSAPPPVVVEPQAGASTDDAPGCSICTDDFERGQDIRVLPCKHQFHPECVDPWLLNVSGTCPLCRVDLRPASSHSSVDDSSSTLTPPLAADAEPSHHRRSALRSILSLRARPNASVEERIAALRRLREHRSQTRDLSAGPADVADVADDADRARRSRRISTRLQDALGVRTRRNGPESSPSPSAPSAAEGSRTSPAP